MREIERYRQLVYTELGAKAPQLMSDPEREPDPILIDELVCVGRAVSKQAVLASVRGLRRVALLRCAGVDRGFAAAILGPKALSSGRWAGVREVCTFRSRRWVRCRRYR